jgi:hypothetical protein
MYPNNFFSSFSNNLVWGKTMLVFVWVRIISKASNSGRQHFRQFTWAHRNCLGLALSMSLLFDCGYYYGVTWSAREVHTRTPLSALYQQDCPCAIWNILSADPHSGPVNILSGPCTSFPTTVVGSLICPVGKECKSQIPGRAVLKKWQKTKHGGPCTQEADAGGSKPA